MRMGKYRSEEKLTGQFVLKMARNCSTHWCDHDYKYKHNKETYHARYQWQARTIGNELAIRLQQCITKTNYYEKA